MASVLASGVPLHAGAEAADWELPEWQYRQRVELQLPEPVSEAVENVPVRVRLAGAGHDVFRLARPDGSDLRFVDAEHGIVLPHELEIYSAHEAQLVAWVRVPQVAPGAAVLLDLYFGSASTEPGLAAAAVWEGYDGVWLMQDGPSRLAIRNAALPNTEGAYATVRGQARFTAGVVGSAVQFDGATTVLDLDGETEAELTTLPPLTIAAWVKPTQLAGTIIGKRDAQHTQWQLFSDASGLLRLREDVTGRWLQHDVAGSQRTALRLGEWQLVGVSIDAHGIPTFFNGAVFETPSNSGGTFVERDIPTSAGGRWSAYPRGTYLWHGEIDDVRVAPRILSQAEVSIMRQAPVIQTRADVLEENSAAVASIPTSAAIAGITTLRDEVLLHAPLLLFMVSGVGLVLILVRVLLSVRQRRLRLAAPERRPQPALTVTKTLDIRPE